MKKYSSFCHETSTGVSCIDCCCLWEIHSFYCRLHGVEFLQSAGEAWDSRRRWLRLSPRMGLQPSQKELRCQLPCGAWNLSSLELRFFTYSIGITSPKPVLLWALIFTHSQHVLSTSDGVPGAVLGSQFQAKTPSMQPMCTCCQSQLSRWLNGPLHVLVHPQCYELLSSNVVISNFLIKELQDPWACVAPTHNQMPILMQTNLSLWGAPYLLGEEISISSIPNSFIITVRGKSRFLLLKGCVLSARKPRGIRAQNMEAWPSYEVKQIVHRKPLGAAHHPCSFTGFDEETETPGRNPIIGSGWATGIPVVQGRDPPRLSTSKVDCSLNRSMDMVT